MTPLRRRMLDELQRRNYASETIRGYILSVKQFAEYFGQSPEKMGAEEIRRFQLYQCPELTFPLSSPFTCRGISYGELTFISQVDMSAESRRPRTPFRDSFRVADHTPGTVERHIQRDMAITGGCPGPMLSLGRPSRRG